MRKGIIRFFILLLASASLCTCVEPLDPSAGPATASDKPQIAISLTCRDQVATKADPVYVPGEERYHENRLTHIDWFIFKSDTGTEIAKMHGRESWTDKDNVTEYFLAVTRDMDNYIQENGPSGVVFVIANLPGSYTHDAIAGLTLTQLKQLALTANFDAYHLTDENDYMTAVFDPQETFVMTTAVIPFTLDVSQPSVYRVNAELNRVAAKITINIALATAIDEVEASMAGRDTTKVTYIQTWYPDMNNVQVYLSYANKESSVGGTPIEYTSTQFFTYNRYSHRNTITQGLERTQITYPEDTLSYHRLAGEPFYSYPMKWKVNDTHAPFIKIIVPWSAYKEQATYLNHDYLFHNGEELQYRNGDTLRNVTRNYWYPSATPQPTFIKSQEFFYKINLEAADGADGYINLLSNNWYNIDLDVAILGSRSDDMTTTISGRYYVVDWGDPHVSAGGIIEEGRYLGIASHEFTMNAISSLDIPVSSSHTLAATVLSKETCVKGNWQNNTRTVTADANGRASITFTDVLNTTMGSSLDCYPMRYKVRIYHADDPNPNNPSLYEDIWITQYPAIYTNAKSGGSAFVNGYYGNVIYHGNTNGYYGYPEGGSTFNQTVQNHNSPYTYTSNGLSVTFATYDQVTSGGNRYYRMGDRNNPGTITVTAPTGRKITGITITYRNGYSNRDVTYQVQDGTTTSSSTQQWTGSASQVVVSMATSTTEGNRNQVRSISVSYSGGIATGVSGTNETSAQNATSFITTPYGNLARYASTQRDMTVISISAFGSDSQEYTLNLNGTSTPRTYLIADPREAAGYTSSDLEPYMIGAGAATEDWNASVNWENSDASKILRGITTMPTYIAPRFMVSSRWGRQVYGETSYENIKKRCATYQEAGYPAGRWRLPTEAEVVFIMSLQRYGFIEQLFNNNARYWIADGNYITTNGTNINVYTPPYQGNSGQSSRCIYDLWYWGEDPITPTNVYHIAP